MNNLSQMMKQAQKMQAQMAEMQEKLKTVEITGQSGAGMIEVTLNGKGDARKLKISPELLVPDEVEVLEDLVLAAFNDAKGKIELHMAEEMAKLTGGFKLPAGFEMPF